MHDDLIEIAQAVRGPFELRSRSTAGGVGAAIESRSKRIYTGISIDLACGVGFCAEHSAAAEMLKDRERHISRIVAIGRDGPMVPCGRCRELMVQLSEANLAARIVISRTKTMRLAALLPHHWLNESREVAHGHDTPDSIE